MCQLGLFTQNKSSRNGNFKLNSIKLYYIVFERKKIVAKIFKKKCYRTSKTPTMLC